MLVDVNKIGTRPEFYTRRLDIIGTDIRLLTLVVHPHFLGELQRTAEPFARYPYLTEVLQRLAADWDGRTILPGVEVAL